MNASDILILTFTQSLLWLQDLTDQLESAFPGQVGDLSLLPLLGIGNPRQSLQILLKGGRPRVILVALDAQSLKQQLGYIKVFLELSRSTPVIFLTSEIRTIRMLNQLGQNTSVRLSTEQPKLEVVVTRVRRILGAKEDATEIHSLVGTSEPFKRILNDLPSIARSNETVLISGETGTGKEVVARAIHYLGPRKYHPFVPVHCGALPDELFENELFGHAPGAYTGASGRQTGLVEEARGGTLFLDEAGTLSASAQVKLLRLMQDKEIRPLGSGKSVKVDLRIITASNVDLSEAVRHGTFREDLLYRMNVVAIHLPPLRARRADIPLLAHHFLARSAMDAGKEISGFQPEVLTRLMSYDWPGNIRELEHLVKRGVVFAKEGLITLPDLRLPEMQLCGTSGSFRQAKRKLLGEFEKSFVEEALRSAQGNISHAATLAGINRRSFWELMRKYEVEAH